MNPKRTYKSNLFLRKYNPELSSDETLVLSEQLHLLKNCQLLFWNAAAYFRLLYMDYLVKYTYKL
jgi:hypothetical protein